MTHIHTNEKLKQVFYFTDTDLQDNRQGFMSYRQKRLLRIKSLFRASLLLALVFGWALPCFLATWKGGISHESNIRLILVTASLMALFIIGFVIMRWSGYEKDIRTGKIGSVDIQIDSRFSDGYRFMTNGVSLQLFSAQLDALQENYTYRVYYAPHTKETLSIEILRVDNGLKDRLMP